MEESKIPKPRRSSIKERVDQIHKRNSVGARPNSVENDDNVPGEKKRRSTLVKERALFINNKIKDRNF